ncbi:MAG: ELM1/GtrOC1 family putative glycosyltransferase [Planctomycetaceae bacterium]
MKRRILVVSDGLPGHYKKTNAVAQMVRKRFDADVQWLKVKLRFGGYRRVMRYILNHASQVPDARWLNLFYRIPEELPDAPDMVISSGGKTSFMSAWLGAHYGCPCIFIGQIRGIEKRYFTRIVASNFDYQEDGKHIRSVPATEIDPDVAQEAGEEYLAQTGLKPAPRWTLVIGGDGGGYYYTPADWTQLRDTACRLAAQHGIRWLITTSRRTPPVAEDIFLSPEIRACADDILIYNRDSRVVYNAFLGLADVVVCLEDSGKMLTESVASGNPVLSVRPPIAKTNDRSWALIHRFETAGYIKRMTLDELGRESFADFVANHRGPAEPIMKRVREEVNEYLSTLDWAA